MQRSDLLRVNSASVEKIGFESQTFWLLRAAVFLLYSGVFSVEGDP